MKTINSGTKLIANTRTFFLFLEEGFFVSFYKLFGEPHR